MFRLKQLREESQKSMAQVARELSIPYTTYVNYEKGEREPNSETLILLARYFGCSVDYLIGCSNVRQIPDFENISPIKYAAYSELENESDEVAEDVLNFIRFTKAQKRKDHNDT